MSESEKRPSAENQSKADGAPACEVTKATLARDVVLYSLARMLLVAAIAGIILGGASLVNVEVPLLVAAIFGVLIALPLSLVLFGKLRERVNESIAVIDAQRQADRADLHARLRGEDR